MSQLTAQQQKLVDVRIADQMKTFGEKMSNSFQEQLERVTSTVTQLQVDNKELTARATAKEKEAADLQNLVDELKSTQESTRLQYATDLQALKDDYKQGAGGHPRASSKDKEFAERIARAIKDAKTAVPQLTSAPQYPGNYAEWKKMLQKVLQYDTHLGEFIAQVKPTGKDMDSIVPLPTDHTALLALIPKHGLVLDKLVWVVWYDFLTSKMTTEERQAVSGDIPEEYDGEERLFMLVTHLKNRYEVDNGLVKEHSVKTFDSMVQEPGEVGGDKVMEWSDKVKRMAKNVNDMYDRTDPRWKKAGLQKIDDSQVWTRFRSGLNTSNKELLTAVMATIDAHSSSATLFKKLQLIKNSLKTADILHPDSEAADRSYAFAATEKANGPCFHYKGSLDSCPFNSRCRFEHIDDAKDRAAALKAAGYQKDWQSTGQRKYRNGTDTDEPKSKRKDKKVGGGRRERDRPGSSGSKHKRKSSSSDTQSSDESSDDSGSSGGHSSRRSTRRHKHRSRGRARAKSPHVSKVEKRLLKTNSKLRAFLSRANRKQDRADRRRQVESEESTDGNEGSDLFYEERQRSHSRTKRRGSRRSGETCGLVTARGFLAQAVDISGSADGDASDAGDAMGGYMADDGVTPMSDIFGLCVKIRDKQKQAYLQEAVWQEERKAVREIEREWEREREAAREKERQRERERKIERKKERQRQMEQNESCDTSSQPPMSTDGAFSDSTLSDSDAASLPKVLVSSDSNDSSCENDTTEFSEGEQNILKEKEAVYSRRQQKAMKAKLDKTKRSEQSALDKQRRQTALQHKQDRLTADMKKEELRQLNEQQKRQQRNSRKHDKAAKLKEQAAADKAAATRETGRERQRQAAGSVSSEYVERNRLPTRPAESEEGESDFDETEKKFLKVVRKQAIGTKSKSHKVRKCFHVTMWLLATCLMLYSAVGHMGTIGVGAVAQGVGLSMAVANGLAGGFAHLGLGFVHNHTAGTIHIDNRTIELSRCYMAKFGKGPNSGALRAVDGGCTASMSGEEHVWVGPRKQLARPKQIFGFDSASNPGGALATEVGSIRLPCTRNGKPATTVFKNVLYVPAMGETTLISQGQLDDKGYMFSVANGVTTCFDKHMKVQWEAPKSGGLYRFRSTEDCMGKINKAYMTMDEAHWRLGHPHEKRLRTLGDFTGEMSA